MTAALLMVVVNAPAFQYGLYGEYFEFVGFLYKSNGNLAQAMFTPSNNGFVRPMDSLLTLLSYRLLSLDPFILHLRNLALALILCGLFYALLSRYADTWYARVFPVLWLALSKVHFEGIGVINVFGTTLASIFILAALWMLDTYLTRATLGFYLAGIMFGLLAIFSKESAISVAPTVVALVFSRTTGSIGARVWRAIKLAAPLAIGILALFSIKRFLVGHALPVVWFYEPHLSWVLFSRNFIAFTGALANLAFTDELRIGVGGIGWLLGHVGVLTPSQGQLLDAEQCAALAVLLSVTIIQNGRRLASGFFALTLMAVSFSIYTTIENLGLRYEYEFLLGATFLGALLLDNATRQTRIAFAVTLLLFGINGTISNYNSYNNWQYVAKQASEALPRLLSIVKGYDQQHFAFVTERKEFWVFSVGASGETFPMLPELAGRPNIQISYLSHQELRNLGPEAGTDEMRIVDIDNGLLIYPDDFQQPLTLSRVSPDATQIYVPFNIQPDGSSAIVAYGENITLGTVIYWNGQPLQTAIGGHDWASAIVPDALFSQPGDWAIYLDNGIRRSQTVAFRVQTP
jgi:hypothetical protein